MSGRWETERGDEAVGLGALERADGANFSVFEKSLLKLFRIIGKYKYRGELICSII